MNRRELFRKSAAFGALAGIPAYVLKGQASLMARTQQEGSSESHPVRNPLTPPPRGPIPVAFVISEGTQMIDFAGPWEVFQDAMVPARGGTIGGQAAFRLYTVAENTTPVRTSGGLKVTPKFTFANAPAPKVIVIPAQNGASGAMLQWIRNASKHADVTMSVCTGSYVLAKAGLLSGKAATTHHIAYREFAVQFPDVQVKRGARFVEAGNVATAGGLSSGIDLALRVVERYFGYKSAVDTAYFMEYQGEGWKDPGANAVYAHYAQTAVSTDEHPLCPVCSMEVDRATAVKSVYKGKTYYFCSGAHKAEFDAAPEKWN